VSNTHLKKNTWRLCGWKNSRDSGWRPDLSVTKPKETNDCTQSLSKATSQAASIMTVCWCNHWCTHHQMTCPLITEGAKNLSLRLIQREAQLSRQRGALSTIKALKTRRTRRIQQAQRAKRCQKKLQRPLWQRSLPFLHLCHSIETSLTTIHIWRPSMNTNWTTLSHWTQLGRQRQQALVWWCWAGPTLRAAASRTKGAQPEAVMLDHHQSTVKGESGTGLIRLC